MANPKSDKTWHFWGERDGYLEFVNKQTGVIKRTKLATTAQMEYLNKLRANVGKKPVKTHLVMFKATAEIEKYKKLNDDAERQQRLF